MKEENIRIPICICEICGENIEMSNSRLQCQACGALYNEMFIPDLNMAYFNKEKAYHEALKYMKEDFPDFDAALNAFSKLKRHYPTWSVPYWGMALAKFSVRYEHQESEKVVPVCYRTTYDTFSEDEDYKLAIQYADPTLKSQYINAANRVELACRIMREEAYTLD